MTYEYFQAVQKMINLRRTALTGRGTTHIEPTSLGTSYIYIHKNPRMGYVNENDSREEGVGSTAANRLGLK